MTEEGSRLPDTLVTLTDTYVKYVNRTPLVVKVVFIMLFVALLLSSMQSSDESDMCEENLDERSLFYKEYLEYVDSSDSEMMYLIPPVQHSMIDWIHEPRVCKNHSTPDLLILVHSYVYHFTHRNVFRRTIGKYNIYNNLKTKVVFVIGYETNQKLMKKVNDEIAQHHDILMLDIPDSYTKLTYRVVGWLKWFSKSCENVQHVIKLDDDTFINMFTISTIYNACGKYKITDGFCTKMSCNVWKAMVPHRSWSRYRVSLSQFSRDLYPDFCPGYAVFIPAPLMPQLLNATKFVQFLWLDDIYLTGLLVEYLGIEHHQASNFTINTLLKRYPKIDGEVKLVAHFKDDIENGEYERHWGILEKRHTVVMQ